MSNPTFKIEACPDDIASHTYYRKVIQIGGKFDGCSEIVLDSEVGRTIRKMACQERGDPTWFNDYSWNTF
jgi:hypothetical protein